jgi:hypothetical protein
MGPAPFFVDPLIESLKRPMSSCPSRPIATRDVRDGARRMTVRTDKIITSMMSMQIRHGFARQSLHDHVQLGDPHRGHGDPKPRTATRDSRQANLEQ